MRLTKIEQGLYSDVNIFMKQIEVVSAVSGRETGRDKVARADSVCRCL